MEAGLGEVLTLASRDVGAVEETWRQFVPSAALQRVEKTLAEPSKSRLQISCPHFAETSAFTRKAHRISR